jgi:general secretion pathway protein G
MRQTQPTSGRGFTLIELLIAMAIILTIAAIAVPNFIAAMDLARVARAVGDIKTIEEEITLYDVIYNLNNA